MKFTNQQINDAQNSEAVIEALEFLSQNGEFSPAIRALQQHAYKIFMQSGGREAADASDECVSFALIGR